MSESIGKYLGAERWPILPGQKTYRWGIYSKSKGGLLGEVKWYAPWRSYCFEPMEYTVFNDSCLRDIAKFCEERTKAQRVHAEAARREG